MGKSKSVGGLTLSFHPLTPTRWHDFELLFGPRGACGGCWCMYWRRTRPVFEKGKGAGNRRAMKAIVEQGREPGILAYAGQTAVGWCSVAPREEFIRLGLSRILKPVDDVPVWSISCLFINRDYRNRGISADFGSTGYPSTTVPPRSATKSIAARRSATETPRLR